MDTEEFTRVPATRVLDPVWLAEQIRLRGLMWGTGDPRTLGTLWWYSAAPLLVAPAVAAHVAGGPTPSCALADTTFQVQPSSRLVGAHSSGVLASGVGPLAEAIREAFATCIDALAPYVPRPRPLWAIAGDAVAERFVAAGREQGRVAEAEAAAVAVIEALGPQVPAPRFVDVPGLEGSRREVRRCSCCLLYLAPDRTTCGNCPRRAVQAASGRPVDQVSTRV